MKLEEELKKAYLAGHKEGRSNRVMDAYKSFKIWYRKYRDSLQIHELVEKNKGRMIRTKQIQNEQIKK